MPLDLQQKTYYEVDESDLSKFISDYYGKPYRMQQYEMLSQDTYRFVEVDGDESEDNGGVDGWPSKEEAEAAIAEWLALDHTRMPSYKFEREYGTAVELLMWDLCRKGEIPAGEYLILVHW